MTNDEVTQYQLGRYISSNEALWRIFGFKIHERHPTVVHLNVHLENGQRICFTEDTVKEKIANPSNTTLTAFFELCKRDNFAKTLLYHEVPTYYTWNTSTKQFCRRKQGSILIQDDDGDQNDIRYSDAIGRVYAIHPNNTECFFLRMLLHSVTGPTSFEDIKTIDGYICSTYREACQILGLLEEDSHWDSTLTEATLFSVPSHIRVLFAIILTTCNPSDPKGSKQHTLIKNIPIYIFKLY